jgi:hypothetical protein
VVDAHKFARDLMHSRPRIPGHNTQELKFNSDNIGTRTNRLSIVSFFFCRHRAAAARLRARLSARSKSAPDLAAFFPAPFPPFALQRTVGRVQRAVKGGLRVN